MDFAFTDEQKLLRNSMREFVDKEIKGEYARDLDEDPSKMFIDDAMWQKIKDLGIFASSVPTEYGGLGGRFMDDVIIGEEFARGSCAVAMSIGVTTGLGQGLSFSVGMRNRRGTFFPK